MKSTLDTIIEELFALDPTLRAHEKEVRTILSRMIDAKSDVRIDDRFMSELRTSLMHAPTAVTPTRFQHFLSLFERHALASGAVMAASLLLIIGVVTYNTQSDRAIRKPLALFNGGPSLNVREQNAFGSLNYLSGMAGGNVQLGAPEAKSSLPMVGLGAGGNPVMDSAASSDMRMVMPYMVYTYKYTGEEISVPADTLPVYRRVKQMPSAGGILDAVRSLSDRMLNLASFGLLTVQTMTFLQDTDHGHSITLDFFDGRASIQPHYQKWYVSESCTLQGCPAPTPLTMNDIPSDETLINISNDFLSDHGIDASRYGVPLVDSQWKNNGMPMPLGRETEKMMIAPPYIPDVLTVVYPIIVDGHTIQEYNGMPYGLRVNVDIRKQKVQGLWNLTGEMYDKSEYAAETNTDRIKKIAERGGTYGYVQGAQVVELNLGTPTVVYIQHHLSQNPYDPAQELFIPALRFPITNPPQDQPYFQNYVTVPLIKDVLDTYDQAPMPVDMPVRIMTEPAEKR